MKIKGERVMKLSAELQWGIISPDWGLDFRHQPPTAMMDCFLSLAITDFHHLLQLGIGKKVNIKL